MAIAPRYARPPLRLLPGARRRRPIFGLGGPGGPEVRQATPYDLGEGGPFVNYARPPLTVLPHPPSSPRSRVHVERRRREVARVSSSAGSARYATHAEAAARMSLVHGSLPTRLTAVATVCRPHDTWHARAMTQSRLCGRDAQVKRRHGASSTASPSVALPRDHLPAGRQVRGFELASAVHTCDANHT